MRGRASLTVRDVAAHNTGISAETISVETGGALCSVVGIAGGAEGDAAGPALSIDGREVSVAGSTVVVRAATGTVGEVAGETGCGIGGRLEGRKTG